MELNPTEKDKLLIFTAGLVAERRKARGLKLNYPEAIAYISAALLEGARDGMSVSELMHYGTTLLSRKSVEDYYTCMNLIDKDRWNKDLIIKQHWMAASE